METPEKHQSSKKILETPLKWRSSGMMYQESPKSSLLFSAQARSYEKKIRIVRRVKNPFEPDDPTILEEKTCSPNILQIEPEPEEFSWSIDEISKIQPAAIDSPQFVEEYDENREFMAHAASERYFSSTHSILSPEDAYQGTWRSPAFSTPTAPNSAKTISSTPSTKTRLIPKIDVGVQTKYSFPPELPPEVEEILKPYLCENREMVESDDSSLLNTSTLRRKLFFNKGDEDLSPVKYNTGQLALGCFTPSPMKSAIISRIDWSVEKGKIDDSLISPNLSPIQDKDSPHSQMSVASPDFSAISISEVSMITVDSLKRTDFTEEMVVSTDEHKRIFSSTIAAKEQQSGSLESGYGTTSYDVSSTHFGHQYRTQIDL